MRARYCVAWILVLLPVNSASAQSAASGRPGPRAILPRDHEVAVARSAAPAEVSRNATVLALTPKGFEVAEREQRRHLSGEPQPAREPGAECLDPEGSVTVAGVAVLLG